MPLPLETSISQLGFTSTDLSGVSQAVNNLTKGDLLSLYDINNATAAVLQLTVNDLVSFNAVAKSNVRTGGGGSGNGGTRCCCCIACCCCCCCAVSVEQSSAVA